ncbi:allophanate hydrolase-related protein [Halomonas garicola]|uniref:allophanate hydrolase-related protein n=1 Tax=Halomonas garicola TaxID=1690008 RepID=UPI00289DD9E6|nr:gamma-glutamylcyclotransferase [Halomonas garicola]
MQNNKELKVRMFVNGQALAGGSISFALAGSTFLGQANTAPSYRFYAVRDEFPGLVPAQDGGASIPGELYELPYAQLRESLLPNEPVELELMVIELEDGSGSLSMRLRESLIDGPDVVDITHSGGWLAYQAGRQSQS